MINLFVANQELLKSIGALLGIPAAILSLYNFWRLYQDNKIKLETHFTRSIEDGSLVIRVINRSKFDISIIEIGQCLDDRPNDLRIPLTDDDSAVKYPLRLLARQSIDFQLGLRSILQWEFKYRAYVVEATGTVAKSPDRRTWKEKLSLRYPRAKSNPFANI